MPHLFDFARPVGLRALVLTGVLISPACSAEPVTQTAIGAAPVAVAKPAPGIQLTEAAAKQLKAVLSEASDKAYVVVSLEFSVSCTGFKYEMAVEESPSAKTHRLTTVQGVRMAIARRSDVFLQEATINWIDTPEQRGFKFTNPGEQTTIAAELRRMQAELKAKEAAEPPASSESKPE